MTNWPGYSFKNPELLERALRHRSAGKPNYERMEFLGDSVLGLVASEWLFLNYPKIDEGGLTRMRSRLVREETLAHLGKKIQLGDHIELGPGELKSGGFRRDSIIADVFEALIAAIYLDSGKLDAARLWILDLLEGEVDYLLQKAPLKDAKTRLQEVLQATSLPLPEYALIESSGPDHKKHFKVACLLSDGREFFASGTSRRKAEQAAAEQAICALETDADG